MPGTRATKRATPVASVTLFCVKPVSGFRTVTVTPGSTPCDDGVGDLRGREHRNEDEQRANRHGGQHAAARAGDKALQYPVHLWSPWRSPRGATNRCQPEARRTYRTIDMFSNRGRIALGWGRVKFKDVGR